MVPEAAEARRRAEVPPRLLPQARAARGRSTRAAGCGSRRTTRSSSTARRRAASCSPASSGRESRRCQGAARSRRCGRIARRSSRCSRRCLQDGRAVRRSSATRWARGCCRFADAPALQMERGIPLPDAARRSRAFPAADDRAAPDRPWSQRVAGWATPAVQGRVPRTWDMSTRSIFQRAELEDRLHGDAPGRLQRSSTSTSTRRRPSSSRAVAPRARSPRATMPPTTRTLQAGHPPRRGGSACTPAKVTPFSVRRGREGNHLFFYDVPARAACMESGAARAAVWRVGA